MSITNDVFDVEAQKLQDIITNLENEFQAAYNTLTEAQREIRRRIIDDLQQAWRNAVLNWNHKHHFCRA